VVLPLAGREIIPTNGMASTYLPARPLDASRSDHTTCSGPVRPGHFLFYGPIVAIYKGFLWVYLLLRCSVEATLRCHG
jgi:hypothetical protein